MSRYTFSIEVHSKEHPVLDKKVRNKVLTVLQDVIDRIVDVDKNFIINEQGYLLNENGEPSSYVRVLDKEDMNQIPF